MKTYIKHIGSTARDLPLEYTVDEENKIVEICADWFDSALFEHFIIFTLKIEKGIDAVRNDRESFCPPPPTYRIFLTMSEQRYEVETHLLLELGGKKGAATIVLLPLGDA